MRFTATIKGLSGFQQQFISAAEDIETIVDGELTAAAQEFVAGAQRDAPKDTAFLTGSIMFVKEKLAVDLRANSEHAAPMEFGTKGKYKPIPGTEQIAAQFKGMKGTGSIFKAIKLWVVRKGIGASFTKSGKVSKSQSSLQGMNTAAFLIARSILRFGVNPHPFFFKQQEVVWPEMVRKVGAKLKAQMKVNVIMPGEIFRPKIITI